MLVSMAFIVHYVTAVYLLSLIRYPEPSESVLPRVMWAQIEQSCVDMS